MTCERLISCMIEFVKILWLSVSNVFYKFLLTAIVNSNENLVSYFSIFFSIRIPIPREFYVLPTAFIILF